MSIPAPADPFPSLSEMSARIDALQQGMAASAMEAVLLTHKPDLYYFGGTAQDAYLYIPVAGTPCLMVRRDMDRAASESFVTCRMPIASIREIPDVLREAGLPAPVTLGMSLDLLPAREYQFFESLFGGSKIRDVSAGILGCRAIKSDWEIARMTDTARLSRDIFDFAASHLTAGETEIAFCGRIEAYAMAHGHTGRVYSRHYRAQGYSPHLMSGWAGGCPGALDSPVCGTGTCRANPYGAGYKPIEENEPVLLDIGTLVNGYHTDETRMLVLGALPREAEAAGKAAIDVLYHVRDRLRPGVTTGEIFDTARDRAAALGFGDSYLGLPGGRCRFVGHGIGLELVEPPILSQGGTVVIREGMVFAVEPKFIFKDRFGAGVESMIQVTRDGARFLSLTEHRIFAAGPAS